MCCNKYVNRFRQRVKKKERKIITVVGQIQKAFMVNDKSQGHTDSDKLQISTAVGKPR